MEYFIKHTRKLTVFIVAPRVQNEHNTLRVYETGALKEERIVPSSHNIFLYYFLWWFYQWKYAFEYYSAREPFILFAGHPIAFIGMSIAGLFRRIHYAYWIGDYFPPVHWSLIAFERLKKYYHDRIPTTFYLSDRINTIMNDGVCINKKNRRTVAWGVLRPKRRTSGNLKDVRLLFVGVIKPSQGIDTLFSYVHKNPHIRLSVIGVCEKALYKTYRKMITDLRISKQVWFPNAFMSDEKLRAFSKKHHIGIALYEKGKNTATYYTDPGKIKTYIEMGLPVIMSDTSFIADHIRRHNAGKVIADVSDLSDAILSIQKNYPSYIRGVLSFARYFDYEGYYSDAFRVLETI